MKNSRTLAVTVLSVVLAPSYCFSQATKPSSAPATLSDLGAAVAAIRHIDQSKITPENRHAKAMEVQRAWNTILRSGKKGIVRLNAELTELEKAGEKDDFFKLGAAALLWQLGKLDQAGTIARIWETTPVHSQYMYTFLTALEASKTQDARALPMLAAVLKDDKGVFLVPAHAMELKWPQTHEFLWATFGPKGLDSLHKLLLSSKDPVQIRSAAHLLGTAQHLPSLPRIRALAAKSKGELRQVAARSLGCFGHPKDYPFLVSGLSAKDPKEAWSFVYALWEYEDVRAAAHVAKLLDTKDRELREEVIACLEYLFSAASVDGLRAYARKTTDPADRAQLERWLRNALKTLNLDWQSWAKKPRKEKEQLAADALKKARAAASKSIRRLDRKQLLELLGQWKKNHRLESEKYKGITGLAVVAAARPEDIPALLEVKAGLCLRLSDECLSEMMSLDRIIKYVGRKRYRKEPGLCLKAELLPQATTAKSRPTRPVAGQHPEAGSR